MKKLEYNITLRSDQNDVDIFMLADIHYGNRYHDKKLFQKYYVGDKDHEGFKTNKDYHVLCIGDLMETALKESKGVQDQNEWIEDQYMWVRDMLTPVAKDGRLIGLIDGNHERRAMRNWFRTNKMLASDLGVPYCGDSALIKVNLLKGCIKKSYTIYAHHGFGSSRTDGGKMNAAKRLALIVADADVYVIGHLHDKFAKISPVFIKGVAEDRLFCMTGAYLTYGGYVEERGYSPPARGSLKVKLHFDINRVSAR